MDNASRKQLERLAAMLTSGQGDSWVLTGAGISVASGIPDFRTPGQGVWTSVDPLELSAETLVTNPEGFFGRCLELFRPALDAQPNPGHRALASLEARGHIAGIITQNIDGLHQAAGSRRVIEVHGHLRTGRCTSCHGRVPLEQLRDQLERQGRKVPLCPSCQGVLRPDVVLFGDPMPEEFDQALALVQNCSLLLVVGSSLEVFPAGNLAGCPPGLAIINLEPTPWDSRAEVCLRGRTETVLPELVSLLPP